MRDVLYSLIRYRLTRINEALIPVQSVSIEYCHANPDYCTLIYHICSGIHYDLSFLRKRKIRNCSTDSGLYKISLRTDLTETRGENRIVDDYVFYISSTIFDGTTCRRAVCVVQMIHYLVLFPFYSSIRHSTCFRVILFF